MKEFSKAGVIGEEIDTLQEKLDKERIEQENFSSSKHDDMQLSPNVFTINDEEVTFVISSRAELDKIILCTSHKVDVAAAFKDFNNATRFHKLLEELQELKDHLPSREDILAQLNAKRAEFDEVVSEK